MRLPTVLAVLTAASSVAAADLTVDHPGIACVVAGKHPIIAARLAPEEQVARARVYFRGGGQSRWYFVDMAVADGRFRGTLPKPTMKLKTIEYYVDGLGRSMAEARSANHEPRVVPDEASCRGEAALLLADQARVVVGGAPQGAPVPEGFSAEGVTAAAALTVAPKGGGISGKTVGLGLAAIGAIGVGVAAAGGGGDGGAPSTPATTPAGGTSTTPSTSAPGGTTVTFTGNIFGPGWHRGDCTIPEQLNARFTTRTSGRADLTLTFQPRFEQMLSLSLAPQAPVSAGTAQGPGPTLTTSFDVQGSTAYTARVCVPVGPALDPGPFAVTLTITHP